MVSLDFTPAVGLVCDLGFRAAYQRVLGAGCKRIGEEPFLQGMLRLWREVKKMEAGMSGRTGIRTCAELRHLLPRGAILVLSVNDDRERQVEALEAEVDHYVTRPFHLRELTARIRATLRAALAAGVQTEEAVFVGEAVGDTVGEIVVGEMSLDPVRRLARKAGRQDQAFPQARGQWRERSIDNIPRRLRRAPNLWPRSTPP